MRSPLVVITGPTASGKTALALDVAKLYNGEIICADSRTIYKGMDIGTAKPSEDELQSVKHHLIDVVKPGEDFTVADFKRMANTAIDDITARGHLPIMVGGTGLYIDSILFDFEFGGPADKGLRGTLQHKTTEELLEICRKNYIILPENQKNKRYLIRAIESGGQIKQSKRLRPNTIVVALTIDREDLRQRITYRAEVMLQRGVLDETRKLAKKYGWDNEAMKANVYPVLRRVIEGKIDTDVAIAEIVTRDMQLAKRQMTWFKRDPYIVWGEPSQLLVAIKHFVHQNVLDDAMSK